jgi:hypothetical protein
VKGDKVEIVIDTGGATKTYEVAATRAGRRVEVVNRRGLVEVTELTRSGSAVRTARFMASRVVALVEHPADDRHSRSVPGAGGAATSARHAGQGRRRAGPAAPSQPFAGPAGEAGPP